MPAGLDLPRLFNTLTTLLKLRPGPHTEPRLGMVVTPVIDVQEILQDHLSDATSKDLTPAAGTYTVYFTVPGKKRWQVRQLIRASTIGASRIRLNRGGGAVSLSIAATAGGIFPGEGLILGPGQTIGMDTTGNAGDGSIELAVHYSETDFVT